MKIWQSLAALPLAVWKPSKGKGIRLGYTSSNNCVNILLIREVVICLSIAKIICLSRSNSKNWFCISCSRLLILSCIKFMYFWDSSSFICSCNTQYSAILEPKVPSASLRNITASGAPAFQSMLRFSMLALIIFKALSRTVSNLLSGPT